MISRETALTLHECEAWKRMTPRERALLQLAAHRNFMPSEQYHADLCELLGRDVWNTEMRDPDRLLVEFATGKEQPPGVALFS